MFSALPALRAMTQEVLGVQETQLTEDGQRKVLDGRTSIDELLRVTAAM